MSIWKRIREFLPVAAISAAILGAGTPVASAESVVDEIVERGTIRLGLATFVPWAMRDKKGDLIGFEIDVANKLAEDMGVKVEFVPTVFSGIIPALIAKKFDFIIGGLTITTQRNLTINYSNPYSHSGQQMAANTELAGSFKTREDFNASGVSIACRRGATSCTVAQKLFPNAELRQFDEDAQAFQEVVNGNAHAMMSSAPKPRFWADAYPGKISLPFEGETLSLGNEAFGVRKGDYDAINLLNNWILVQQSDGWLQERHDYWFKDQSAWKDMVAPQ